MLIRNVTTLHATSSYCTIEQVEENSLIYIKPRGQNPQLCIQFSVFPFYFKTLDNNRPAWTGRRWRRCWRWNNLRPRRRWRHYIRWLRRQSVRSWNWVIWKRTWHIRNRRWLQRRYWKIRTGVKWWRIRADLRWSSCWDVNFRRGRYSRYFGWNRRPVKTRHRRRKLRRAPSWILVG